MPLRPGQPLSSPAGKARTRSPGDVQVANRAQSLVAFTSQAGTAAKADSFLVAAPFHQLLTVYVPLGRSADTRRPSWDTTMRTSFAVCCAPCRLLHLVPTRVRAAECEATRRVASPITSGALMSDPAMGSDTVLAKGSCVRHTTPWQPAHARPGLAQAASAGGAALCRRVAALAWARPRAAWWRRCHSLFCFGQRFTSAAASP